MFGSLAPVRRTETWVAKSVVAPQSRSKSTASHRPSGEGMRRTRLTPHIGAHDGARARIPAAPVKRRNRVFIRMSGWAPNGSRLSCGALKKESSFLRIYARRQLQALVRLRTTSHSSGPSSPGAQSGTHRRLTPMGTVRPNGPLLGTRHARRPPSATGPSLESALESNRTTPTDAGFRLGADHVGVQKKTWFGESCAA